MLLPISNQGNRVDNMDSNLCILYSCNSVEVRKKYVFILHKRIIKCTGR